MRGAAKPLPSFSKIKTFMSSKHSLIKQDFSFASVLTCSVGKELYAMTDITTCQWPLGALGMAYQIAGGRVPPCPIMEATPLHMCILSSSSFPTASSSIHFSSSIPPAFSHQSLGKYLSRPCFCQLSSVAPYLQAPFRASAP